MAEAIAGRLAGRGQAQDHPYRPWHTLQPTAWTPAIESDSGETLIGAATGMTDVLGRHAWAAAAAWAGGRARPDWSISYAYDRWAPTLFASYADDTDPFTGGVARSRELVAGALVPFRRVRIRQTLLGAFDAERDDIACDVCGVARRSIDRRALRAGWLFDTRRAFGYSISVEEGAQVETAVELTRRVLGADDDATALIVDVRGYQRVFSRHTVVALRAAAAVSSGAESVRRRYGVGGSGPSVAAFDFGQDSIGLLRGFSTDAATGTRAVVANADLRIPLLQVQRGFRTWPIFFRSIHASVFGDAGHAWDRDFAWRDLRSSVGAELSLDTVLGHYVPVTFTGGLAATRDPFGGRRRLVAFGRIGHAF